MKLQDYQASAARKILISSVARDLNYNPDTGQLRWIYRDKPAGHQDKNGYIMLKREGKKLRAHIVIWLMQTGDIPTVKVDHVDTNGYNNRWLNLRLAPGSVNQLNNNASNIRIKGSRHNASVQYHGKSIYLGSFQDSKVAAKCVALKKQELILKELS